jgi:hypothetical protein
MAPHACSIGQTATLRGDSPGAISYDVYRQLRPVNAERLALFVGSGEVKMLSDGLQICMVHDDGVSDPNAVMVRTARDTMSYWVNIENLNVQR